MSTLEARREPGEWVDAVGHAVGAAPKLFASRPTPKRPGDAPRPRSAKALERRCRGRDVFDAAKKGLEGAVRHFLKKDPTCVKKKDEGRDAWLVGFRWECARLCWLAKRLDLHAAPRLDRPALGGGPRLQLHRGAAAEAQR